MAYAALVSLKKTTDLVLNPQIYRISVAEEEIITSTRAYVMSLISFFDDFPDKVSRLEAKIRELANETEAIAEDLMWNQNRPNLSTIEASSFKLLRELREKTEKIGVIVGDVIDERALSNPDSPISRPGVAITSKKDVIVGLYDDLIAMKDRLCGESHKLEVIPIVGMGGIGKTTLARYVYDDPLIVDRFDIRAWVTVSQDYSAQKIIATLIHSMKLFISEQDLNKSIVEQEVIIYQTLKSRRYFIVVDDVWSTEVWDVLRGILPDDDNGNRIMLTTRLSDVAAYPDPHSPLHMMRFMDDYHSWDLLRQKVVSFPPDLEDVGKEIARRCAGLPLAVVLVAGVLSTVDKSRTSWEEIAKNVNPALGVDLDAILSLSYTHLPHHLRPCLLFIGGFPEDKVIYASRLVKLWVAEGFLKHRDGCSLEEVAEEYLEDLVKKNFVIVNSRKIGGKIKNCSVHDMVRNFCIRKAHEEKFLRIMDQHVLRQYSRNHPDIILDDPRVIWNNRCGISKVWGSTTQTILCFHYEVSDNCLRLLQRSRYLRVLGVIGHLPIQVHELFHLRYLASSGSPKFVKSVLSNLPNLQTLIINRFRSYKLQRRSIGGGSNFSLPLEIWRSMQLRHLILYPAFLLPLPSNPDGADLPLENLQTLSLVQNIVWDEKILQMIPNVKKLGLVYTLNEEYGLHHLKYLCRLEKLEVMGFFPFCWQGKNPNFPMTLKTLILVGGGFPWEDMAIVGSLPNLQELKLLENACNGETWETSDEEFPRLLSLVIEMSSLRRWITPSNPFPRLKLLVLRYCWNLREIPEEIGDIPSLEFIEVYNCRRSLLMSAMKIKEDQESYGNDSLQVQHVLGASNQGSDVESSGSETD